MLKSNEASDKYDKMIVSPKKGVRDSFMIGLQGTLEMWEGKFFRDFCKKGIEKFMKTGKIPLYWMKELKKNSNYQTFLNGYCQ